GVLLAGSDQGTIAYYDKAVTTGVRAAEQTTNVVKLHKGPITALAAGNGSVIESAGVDQKILVWTLPDAGILHTVPAQGIVRALCFSPDGNLLAAAGDSLTIDIVDLPAKKVRAALGGPTDSILCLAFSTDGKLLAS